jgi:hypothetical protein
MIDRWPAALDTRATAADTLVRACVSPLICTRDRDMREFRLGKAAITEL